MQDRLSMDDTGKPKVFRNTLISNARDVCNLLKVINVTNDPELEKARCAVEAMLAGVDSKDLRDSEGTRAVVKKDVGDILDRFSF